MMTETVIVTFEQDGKKAIANVVFETEDNITTMKCEMNFEPELNMGDESEWYDILAARFIETLQNLKA